MCDNIHKFKSFTDAVKNIFGINYYNGYTKNMLIDYCKDNNITINDLLIKNSDKFCKFCGNKLSSNTKTFCNSSCAAKYNNSRRVLSKETKEKIGRSIRNRNENCRKSNDLGIERIGGKYANINICKICGKEFLTKHKNSTYCSCECVHKDPIYINKLRIAQLNLVESGKHIGWAKRNNMPKSEQIWESLLIKNGIIYNHEDRSYPRYSMDFCITKGFNKIDVELDGKQHDWKQRQESDKIRDEILTQNGYIVYRIKIPRNIKDNMDDYLNLEFEKFLNFYLSL